MWGLSGSIIREKRINMSGINPQECPMKDLCLKIRGGDFPWDPVAPDGKNFGGEIKKHCSVHPETIRQCVESYPRYCAMDPEMWAVSFERRLLTHKRIRLLSIYTAVLRQNELSLPTF